MKQLLRLLIPILSVIGLSKIAFAAETASTLPKKIFRARVVYVNTEEVHNKFDNSKNLGGLSKSLNQNLNANFFAQKIPGLDKLIGGLNATKAGMGDQLLNTQLYSNTSMELETYLSALEYGLNEKWTIGVRIPVVSTKIKSSFRAESINNANAISKQVGPSISKDIQAGLGQLAAQKFDTEFFKTSLFQKNGYKSPENFSKTELGDVELGAKYRFYTKPKRDMSVQIGLRLPTGSVSPIDNLFYQGSGNGAYAIGGLFFHDYHFNSSWTTGAMIKTVYNLPDTRKRAVPKNADDSLPSLIESDGQVQNVKRTQALDFESELSLTYNFPNQKWSLWGAYQLINSGADSYSGPGELYYEGLGKASDFRKSDAEFGISFSTIPAYKEKSFPVPLKTELLYKTTLEGVNVAKVSYLRMDMIVFF